ncbi:MerR family transcriptional regulator [Arthrobacter sp. QXT-31]|uniref:MerR family transcriptional regulator n=1 Tax=Arthrobacter sp. QXT-31 TaxID=1357915 RepID=UPI0012FA9437|nr:MerR family transcriptional regulator [Arthrobacter sp. QXT-31]
MGNHMGNRDSAGRGLYAISVVAELVGTGQQNIRLYERRGLLTPERTEGGTRQYSEADLAVLRRIAELLDEGLNLAGVAKVLELEMDNARLRRQLKRARARGTEAGTGSGAGTDDGDLPAGSASQDGEA